MRYLLIVGIIFFGIVNSANAQKSQNEFINDLVSGSYPVYKVIEKSYNKYIFEKVSKPWPIEVTNDGKSINKILVKRAGIIDEEFIPDVVNFPVYFGFNDLRVTYLKGYLYYYKWTSKNAAEIKYVFSIKGGSLSGKIDDYKIALEEYVKKTVPMQSGAKDELKEIAAAEEEAERRKNSLQDRSPKSLKVVIVDLPTELGHGSLIKYGVEATLSDGSVLKTPNLGGKLPWSDFDIEVEGGSSTQEELMVFEDGALIPNDQVVIQVKSVYHSDLKTTKKIDLLYNRSVEISYIGKGGNSGASVGLACSCAADGNDGRGGYKGKDLNINVKAYTNTSTGVTYNKVEVIDAYTGKVLHKLKLDPYTPLVIYNGGGYGGSGSDANATNNDSADGGNGADGGDGGDVNITTGDNVSLFSYNIFNQGGSGGRGGRGVGSYGSSGSAGSSGGSGYINEMVGYVSINW